MKRLSNEGYLLVEILAALGIAIVLIATGWMFLNIMLKDWSYSQSSLEVNYNSREALNRLFSEIRESYGVEILDASEDGWIKVYKTADKSKFITFRQKNNKLFIGFNNYLNSNSELSTGIKEFKVEYIPEGASEDTATGVRVYLIGEDQKKKLDINISVAFRAKE